MCYYNECNLAGVMELADVEDSKSTALIHIYMFEKLVFIGI